MRRIDSENAFASDEQLVKGMIANDPDAWRVFVARHAGTIRAVIARVLRCSKRLVALCEIDEIYSSFLCSLFARDMYKLRAFDVKRGTSLKTWINLLTMHATHDHMRAALRTRAKDVPIELQYELEAPGHNALDSMSRAHDLLIIREAISVLSAKDRELLTLMFELDAPPEVIADKMKVSVNTVYSKKHKIAAKLRAAHRRGAEGLPAHRAAVPRPATRPRPPHPRERVGMREDQTY